MSSRQINSRLPAPQDRQTVLRLSEMHAGEKGRILKIGGNGSLRRRIQEMGLLKDTEIYVEKYAPLRDPLELIVKGYHISLRVEEADQIVVAKTETRAG